MNINQAGLDLIKSFEGLRLTAYQDVGGKWTIGYGHTGDVKSGDVVTSHQADAILDTDADKISRQVSLLLGDAANPNEFSAMVCFAFNLGPAALARSNLLKKFLTGDKDGAAAEFMKWTYAAGNVAPGLVRRRAAEKALFLTPAN